jgi:hypothetical protein
MTRFAIPRIVYQAVTVVLLAATIAAVFQLPASAAPLGCPACHSQVPSHPQPADYRCCVNRQAPALTIGIFSLRPALRTLEANAIVEVAAEYRGDVVPTTAALLSSPPGIFILRI